MNTLEALIAAIRLDPEDRTLRLVYADAAEETGEPLHCAHAELIRVAVGRTGTRGSRKALSKKYRTLLGERYGLKHTEFTQLRWGFPNCVYLADHLELERIGEPLLRETTVNTVHVVNRPFNYVLPVLEKFVERWTAAYPAVKFHWTRLYNPVWGGVLDTHAYTSLGYTVDVVTVPPLNLTNLARQIREVAEQYPPLQPMRLILTHEVAEQLMNDPKVHEYARPVIGQYPTLIYGIPVVYTDSPP